MENRMGFHAVFFGGGLAGMIATGSAMPLFIAVGSLIIMELALSHLTK